MAELIGRDAELRVADRMLDLAAEGRSSLLIRGEAGIGKSTIWDAIVGRAVARGWRTMTARAIAAEAPLMLATLGDLLETVADADIDRLPAPQAAALRAALLRAAPGPGAIETRVLGAAVRAIIDAASVDAPVVIAIDDLQWVDAASAAALEYALRRLPDQRVARVFAVRTGHSVPFHIEEPADERSEVIDVGPLSLAGIHALLQARLGAAPRRSTLVRIHEASGGNPFFALEIARTVEQAGPPLPGEPLPVPDDIEELVRVRIRALPPTGREALLHAAAAGRPDVGLVEAALGRPIADDVRVAEDAGVARLRAGEIAFIHPLYAAAILWLASPADRRAAHARLAAALDAPEERARHEALATDGPDAAVAAEVEAAAAAADRRGGPAGAAELLELALRLTPAGDPAVAERSIELASALQRGGELDRAATLLEGVIAGTASRRVRARARLALAAIKYETDLSTVAVELSEAAIADAAEEPDLLVRALATSAAVDWADYGRRSRRIDEAFRRLEALEDPDPTVTGLVLMQRIGQDADHGRPLDPDLIERALAAERVAPARNVSERFSAALGAWLKYADQFDAARAWMERAHQAAIDEGDEGSLPYALSHLPELELWTGNWRRARALAETHLALAAEHGLESQRRQATYNLAMVDIHEGNVEAARAEINDVLAAARREGDAWAASSLEPLLGMLELSLGDDAAAAAHMREATRLRDDMGQSTPRRFDADLVEALVRLGDLESAGTVVDAMDRRADAFGLHSARALSMRARALVDAAAGRTERALELINGALAEHDAVPIPFDRARTLLDLGRIRRRRRERASAGEALGEALATFEGLGARIWAARTRAELDRVSLRRAHGDRLTDGERRVAELVATGLTNREVAAALFVSPKTVEANLARAYSKLGIRSRAQLGAALTRPA